MRSRGGGFSSTQFVDQLDVLGPTATSPTACTRVPMTVGACRWIRLVDALVEG